MMKPFSFSVTGVVTTALASLSSVQSKIPRHGIVYKVNLRCDKGRKFTSTATKRDTSTRLRRLDQMPGPFQATVKKLQQDVEWTVTCDRPEHNHEPSDTTATHPSLRKPTID